MVIENLNSNCNNVLSRPLFITMKLLDKFIVIIAATVVVVAVAASVVVVVVVIVVVVVVIVVVVVVIKLYLSWVYMAK